MKNSDLAILGLIHERPRHGYQIEQVMEARNMREWTEIGFSSIYYILGRLAKQGYITSRLEQSEGKGPARKVYRITASGRDAWHRATVEALSTPKGGDLSFLLGMVGLPAIPTEEAIPALRAYQEKLVERRDRVQERWREAGERLPLALDGLFGYSVHIAGAEIAWIEGFIAKLERSLEEIGQDLTS